MPLGITKKFVGIAAILASAMTPILSGCDNATEDTKTPGGTDDVVVDDKPRERYLPYGIRFRLDGKPVVVNERGEEVALEVVKPPFKATSLVDVETVSVVTYTGSCKQIYNIGGQLYAVTLPDAYCKKL